MAIGSLTSAKAYLAQSYRSAQSEMATALSRLGSNRRFVTASQDSEGYATLSDIRGNLGVYEASLASANSISAQMDAFDGWATAMLEQLGDLKAAAGDAEQEAAIEAVLAELDATTYNGAAINLGDQATTMKGVDGTDTAIAVAAVVGYTGTAATVDADIAAIQAFAEDVEEYKTRAEATAAAASAMANTTRVAEESLVAIDAAAESNRYTTADIRQQSALAMIAQGNVSQMAILKLMQ